MLAFVLSKTDSDNLVPFLLLLLLLLQDLRPKTCMFCAFLPQQENGSLREQISELVKELEIAREKLNSLEHAWEQHCSGGEPPANGRAKAGPALVARHESQIVTSQSIGVTTRSVPFIQSASRYCLTFTHSYTGGGVSTTQGNNQHVRSVLLRDTSTLS